MTGTHGPRPDSRLRAPTLDALRTLRHAPEGIDRLRPRSPIEPERSAASKPGMSPLDGRDATGPDHLPEYLTKVASNCDFMAAGAASMAFFCWTTASAFLPLSNRARA